MNALVSLKKKTSSLQQNKPVDKSAHTTGQMAAALYGSNPTKPPVTTKKSTQQETSSHRVKEKATQAGKSK